MSALSKALSLLASSPENCSGKTIAHACLQKPMRSLKQVMDNAEDVQDGSANKRTCSNENLLISGDQISKHFEASGIGITLQTNTCGSSLSCLCCGQIIHVERRKGGEKNMPDVLD